MAKVPSELTVGLAEFLGALIGDGCLAKQKHQFVFTGDAELDLEYYQNTIQPTVRKIFGLEGNITFRSDSRTLLYRFASKEVHQWIVDSWNITPRKSASVRIPQKIMESSEEIRCACLRGLFDTDGGVYFDRRESYDRPYIRICFVSISDGLIRDVLAVLATIGIKATYYKRGNAKAFNIQINGYKEASKFCQQVGFSNPRHFRKLPKEVLP